MEYIIFILGITVGYLARLALKRGARIKQLEKVIREVDDWEVPFSQGRNISR